MTEQEVTECAAIAQLLVASIIEDPRYFLGMVLDLEDSTDEACSIISGYLSGLLDIARGTE